MTYFTNCKTIEALKAEFRKLCKIHHPDLGGDTATMAAINAEYDRLFKILQNQHEETGSAPDQGTKHTEAPEEFRHIIEQLLKMNGIIIELCGSWIWVSGDTMSNKDALKAAGLRWASKKRMWYWHGPDEVQGKHKAVSMEKIRSKYGSAIIDGMKARPAYLQ